MMTGALDVVCLLFSLLALACACVFFLHDRRIAGFAFLVVFIISFSAVLNQKIIFSSVIGLSVERQSASK
jgi:uncharacterized membrane protein YhaH (DUF805 family)